MNRNGGTGRTMKTALTLSELAPLTFQPSFPLAFVIPAFQFVISAKAGIQRVQSTPEVNANPQLPGFPPARE